MKEHAEIERWETTPLQQEVFWQPVTLETLLFGMNLLHKKSKFVWFMCTVRKRKCGLP